MEVNFSPSLGTDEDIDVEVKKPLIRDIAYVLNFIDYNKQEYEMEKVRSMKRPKSSSAIRPKTTGPALMSSAKTKRNFSQKEETVGEAAAEQDDRSFPENRFKQIFPFSERVENASYALSTGKISLPTSSLSARKLQKTSLTPENAMKLIVNEIKCIESTALKDGKTWV